MIDLAVRNHVTKDEAVMIPYPVPRDHVTMITGDHVIGTSYRPGHVKR